MHSKLSPNESITLKLQLPSTKILTEKTVCQSTIVHVYVVKLDPFVGIPERFKICSLWKTTTGRYQTKNTANCSFPVFLLMTHVNHRDSKIL